MIWLDPSIGARMLLAGFDAVFGAQRAEWRRDAQECQSDDAPDSASTVLETGFSMAGGGTVAKSGGDLALVALGLRAWKDYRGPFAMTGIGFRSFSSVFATAGLTWAYGSFMIKGAITSAF